MARRAVLAAGLLSFVVVLLLRVLDLTPVQGVRAAYFDYMQRMQPRQPVDVPVRVVDIDERSLASLGQWPWPRDRLAQIVDALGDYGAASIVFDVIFAEPDRMSPATILGQLVVDGRLGDLSSVALAALPDNDSLFAESMSGRGVVLGVAQSGGDEAQPIPQSAGFVEIGLSPATALPPLGIVTPIVPVLAQAAAGIGSVNISPFSGSNIVRSVPLVWRSDDALLPGLALEGLRIALDESTIVLIGSNNNPGLVQAVSVGPFEIPTTPEGEVLLHYRYDVPELYISAQDLLINPDHDRLAAAIEGSIVLIGASAAGLLDIRTTALGESVPGVSIHAQLLEQVLLGDFLIRNDLTTGLEFLAFIVIGVIVIGVTSGFNPSVSMIAGGTGAAVVLAASWFAFRDMGVLFDATFPMLGGMMVYASVAAVQFIVTDREKRMIRRSFAHYVAPEVLRQIERSGHQLRLGGDTQPVTVMFTDILNFTPLSERLEASALVSLLNEIFDDLSVEILSEQGTIDKFIGDSIMAFWNAPLRLPDHERRGCLAAIKMRMALRILNARKGFDAENTISMAVGLSSGDACVGNIGSRDRYNYSVIGNTVNAAARLESNCRHVKYDILVSKEIADAAPGLAMLRAGSLALKGISERAETFVVIGDETLAKTPDFVRLRAAHDDLLRAVIAPNGTFDGALDQCVVLAAQVEPGLASFYSRIPARIEDFGVVRTPEQVA